MIIAIALLIANAIVFPELAINNSGKTLIHLPLYGKSNSSPRRP